MTEQGNAPEIAWEELDTLYRETILDHAHSPRNRKPLAKVEVSAHVLNPFCGDEVYVDLSFQDGRVGGVSVRGQGCAISQSSASMMSEVLMGKRLQDLRALSHRFQRMMRGDPPAREEATSLGDLESLTGVTRFPVRIKCALLAWDTLDEALDKYEAKGKR